DSERPFTCGVGSAAGCTPFRLVAAGEPSLRSQGRVILFWAVQSLGLTQDLLAQLFSDLSTSFAGGRGRTEPFRTSAQRHEGTEKETSYQTEIRSTRSDPDRLDADRSLGER